MDAIRLAWNDPRAGLILGAVAGMVLAVVIGWRLAGVSWRGDRLGDHTVVWGTLTMGLVMLIGLGIDKALAWLPVLR